MQRKRSSSLRKRTSDVYPPRAPIGIVGIAVIVTTVACEYFPREQFARPFPSTRDLAVVAEGDCTPPSRKSHSAAFLNTAHHFSARSPRPAIISLPFPCRLAPRIRALARRERRPLPLVRRYGVGSSADLAEAYQVLGLKAGAVLADVKTAFRKLARQHHPDLFPADEVAAAGARFSAIKDAHDTITSALSEESTSSAKAPDFGEKISAAMSRVHHRESDGRLYECWLDLRSGGHTFANPSEALENARMEATQLFFRIRGVVDAAGYALMKEGAIDGILADDPAEVEGATLARSIVANWDHRWVPLRLVSSKTSARGARVRNARSGVAEGWLRPAAIGTHLVLPPPDLALENGSENVVEDELSEDLIVSATDAHGTEWAKSRYAFTMRALVLPPDAAVWAVAAANVPASTAAPTAKNVAREN